MQLRISQECQYREPEDTILRDSPARVTKIKTKHQRVSRNHISLSGGSQSGLPSHFYRRAPDWRCVTPSQSCSGNFWVIEGNFTSHVTNLTDSFRGWGHKAQALPTDNLAHGENSYGAAGRPGAGAGGGQAEGPSFLPEDREPSDCNDRPDTRQPRPGFSEINQEFHLVAAEEKRHNCQF